MLYAESYMYKNEKLLMVRDQTMILSFYIQ